MARKLFWKITMPPAGEPISELARGKWGWGMKKQPSGEPESVIWKVK